VPGLGLGGNSEGVVPLPCYSYGHDQGYGHGYCYYPDLMTDPTNPNPTDPTLD